MSRPFFEKVVRSCGLWMLASAWMPLYVYGNNYPQIRFVSALGAMGVFAVCHATGMLVLRCIFPEKSYRTFVAYGFWLLFWLSRRALLAFQSIRMPETIAAIFKTYGFWLLGLCLIVGCGVYVRFFRRNLRMQQAVDQGNAILGFFWCMLVCLMGIQMGFRWMRDQQTTPTSIQVQNNPSKPLPDIYHILLDGHPGLEAANAIGYDVMPFFKKLEGMGFVTYPQSRSVYGGTPASVSQMLSLQKDSMVVDKTYTMRHHYKVFQTLREQGYDLFIFADRCAEGLYPEQFLRFASNDVMGLLFILLDESPIRRLKYRLGHLYARWMVYAYANMLNQLSRIRSRKPFCAYLHLSCPHPPAIFSKNVIDITSGWLQDVDSNCIRLEALKDNIAGIDALVLPAVKAILNRYQSSELQPIIILHSDHGPSWGVLSGDLCLNNLLAIYMPPSWKTDGAHLKFVNLYRFIFNHLFDTRYSYF